MYLRAALQAGSVEQALRGGHGHERRAFAGAAGLAEDHHVSRIAAEARDVVPNPLQRGDEIHLRGVARPRVLRAADLIEIEIAEDVEPVIH
jgi:hypothetical protein